MPVQNLLRAKFMRNNLSSFFTGRTFLSLDWHPVAKEKFFNQESIL
jgi:hypothetical protein